MTRCHNNKRNATPVTSHDLQLLSFTTKRLSDAGQKTSNNLKVLEALHFKAIWSRGYQIQPAHAETFQWIYSNSPKRRLKFRQWLETRNHVFWIYGKPGSGKSTLMKYLFYNEETKIILQRHWAGQNRLVLAKLFFWNSGEQLQKSLAGVLRALLFEILRQCPELIPAAQSIIPNWPLFDGEEISNIEELLSMYRTVILHSTGIRFCLFIDGLDEFQDAQHDLVDLNKMLRALDCSPNIKLCVSSRPWTVFNDEFGSDYVWTLKLEDLTRDDIYRYVNDKFQEHPQFHKLVTKDSNYSRLMEQVTDRAQGVFLWVFLVTRTLLEGFSYKDSILTMQRRLETFPPDLEAFFHHLIKFVDPIYQRQTARYFSVATLADRPLSAMLFSFLDDVEYNTVESLRQPIAIMRTSEIEDRRDQLQRRLDGATKGLLELTDHQCAPHPYVRFQVEFLHRTVRDFLNNSAPINASFQSSLGNESVALTALCAALAEMKASPDDVTALPRPFVLFLKNTLTEAMAEDSVIRFLDIEGPRLAKMSVFSALDVILYIRSRLYAPSGWISKAQSDIEPNMPLLQVLRSADDVLLETVRLLLCQGCDVNRSMHHGGLRYSIWSHFLMEYVSWADAQEPETIAIQISSLCRLLKLLLSYGANLESPVYLFKKGIFLSSEVLQMVLGADAVAQLLAETGTPSVEGYSLPIRRSKGAKSSAKERPKGSWRWLKEPAAPKAVHPSKTQAPRIAETSTTGSLLFDRNNSLRSWNRRVHFKSVGFPDEMFSPTVSSSALVRTERPDTPVPWKSSDNEPVQPDKQDKPTPPPVRRANTLVAHKKYSISDGEPWVVEWQTLQAKDSSMRQPIPEAEKPIAGGKRYQDYPTLRDSREDYAELIAPDGSRSFVQDQKHSPASKLQRTRTSSPPPKNENLYPMNKRTTTLRRIPRRI